MNQNAVRWGVLGTGGIAEAFARDLQGSGLVVAAVGSRSQEGADAFAERFGIPNAYGSYQALVDSDEVDIIYISTPHPFHAENAKQAITGGKHVLVEKPFTVSAAEAAEVVELGRERGVLVMEAMWTRFLPMMAKLRQLIASGTIGEVRTLLADHNQNLPKDPKHRINAPELGGGALLDLGIYPVSFAYDLFGTPETVQAHGAFTATGVDRQTAIVLGFADGQQAVLHTALDSHGPNRATILGTGGRIEIAAIWYTPTSFVVYDNRGEVIEEYRSDEKLRGMQYQAMEAERLIRIGGVESELMPTDESVRIMQTLDTIRAQIGLRYPGE